MKSLIQIFAFLLIFLSISNLSYSQAKCALKSYTSNFDWRAQNYTFYLEGETGTRSVASPWFAVYNNNLNINDFRLQNPKDYEPADGWVLVQRDFGTSTRRINHPYIILYNKYSGILRVFVSITKVVGQNEGALIQLTYRKNSKRSAVLGHHSGLPYASSVKDFDNNVPVINIPNKYAFDLPYWLHADFVMNYDPCTCEELSQLILKVKLIPTGQNVIDAIPDSKSILWDTPGSKTEIRTNPSTTLVYNRPLGVFNLLETPVVYERRYSIENISHEDFGTVYERILELQYNTPMIKYVINPAAGLSTNPADIDLRVSYVFEGFCIEETESFPIGCFKDFHPAFWYINESGYPGAGANNGSGGYAAADCINEPGNIYLKITGKIKSADKTTDVIFTTKYQVKRVIQGYPSHETIFPSSTCTPYLAPATSSNVSAVCSSAEYKAKVNQYYTRISEEDSLKELNELSKIQEMTETFETEILDLYPNPVSEQATITYAVAENEVVNLFLMNTQGQIVETYFSQEIQAKGFYTVELSLSKVPSGLYLCVLETSKGRVTKRLVKE